MADRALPEEWRVLLASVEQADRPHLERRVRRAVSACGCTAGAVALMAAVVVVVGWWFVAADGRVLLWPEAPLALAAVVVSALVGKALGIGFARTWLWRTIRKYGRREVLA
jgi:membrane protein YdbS with pleckstrin-like domain